MKDNNGAQRTEWSSRSKSSARQRIEKAIACAALAVLPFGAVDAKAAPLGSILSSDSNQGTQLVQAEDVRQRAIESFRQSASDVSQKELPSKLRGTQKEALRIKSEVEDYDKELGRKLRELSGDGVLTIDEVQEELAELRSTHENQLTESLKALADGSAAPPKLGPSESFFSFSIRQLRYTFLERNRPSKFLWLLGGVAIGIGFTAALSFVVRRWVGRTDEARTLRRLLIRLRGPFYLAMTVAASWAWLSSIWVPIEIFEIGRKLSLLGIGVAALWYLWRVSEILPEKTLQGDRTQHTYELFRTILRMALVALFGIYVVEVIVGTDFTALIFGFGVAGFAVTLAAQDGLKNLFGAGTIHADSLFRVGELVRFRGFFGPIEHIGFRSVKLRTLDGHLVTIPNSVLAEDAVENVAARPYIRREVELGLVYDTPPKKMRRAIEIVREVLNESEFILNGEPIRVAFHEFSDYSLNLAVLYHHRETDYWKSKENDSELNLAILERFEEEGIEFAFPTRTLHVDGRLSDTPPGEEAVPDSGERSSASAP